MKRYQVYKNGRAIYNTNSRNSSFREFVDASRKSSIDDLIEWYDYQTGEVIDKYYKNL